MWVSSSSSSLLIIYSLSLILFTANHSKTFIRLKNRTNDKNIYFKFKTTKPKIYVVKPSKGVLIPNKEDTVIEREFIIIVISIKTTTTIS